VQINLQILVRIVSFMVDANIDLSGNNKFTNDIDGEIICENT